MNRKQRNLLARIITVLAATALAVAAIANIKDLANRSEALKAMQYLGTLVTEYRHEKGITPPQSFVDKIKDEIPGYSRLGQFQYRAQWIEPGASDDEILAYVRKDYSSPLVESGYIILRLDGRAEWMPIDEFQQLLQQQQGSFERQMLQ